MPGIRNVISTMGANGEEMLGPDLLLWHYPDSSIQLSSSAQRL